jgi:predicted RNA binding protein YcfA (HicA-like mRNA interferase family)
MNRRKLLRRLASGAVKNVGFEDFAGLVRAFGFVLVRKSGSHNIYTRETRDSHTISGSLGTSWQIPPADLTPLHANPIIGRR